MADQLSDSAMLATFMAEKGSSKELAVWCLDLAKRIADTLTGTAGSVQSALDNLLGDALEANGRADTPDALVEEVEDCLPDCNIERCEHCGRWYAVYELVDVDDEYVGCRDCRDKEPE